MQGPVSKVTLNELRLGAGRGSAPAAAPGTFSLPAALEGLTIELRQGAKPPRQRSARTKAPSATAGLGLGRWLASLGLQLALRALPHLPLTVQNIRVARQV